MMGYQYVCVRCVPHVERGECVNVGVVLHCQDAGFLGAAYRLNPRRLAALSPDVQVIDIRGELERLVALCEGRPGHVPPGLEHLGQRFGWIIAPRSTVVQPGPVHGGLCDDPAKELERLIERLVEPPAHRQSQPPR